MNDQVFIDAIPKIETIVWQKIDQSYWKALRLEWLIVSVLLLLTSIVAVVFNWKQLNSLTIVLIVIGWLIITSLYYIIMQQSFKRRAYAVRQRDILYRSGWIIHKVTACPYNRIQHCSVNAGIIDRKFKLASLILYTAGAGGADLHIRGLRNEIAEQLKELVIAKINTDEETVG